MTDELLPCPFCNGPAEFIGREGQGYRVCCKHCDARGGWGDYGYQAQAAWHKRAALTEPASSTAGEVPAEATEAMIEAGLTTNGRYGRSAMKEIWARMHAASLSPSGEPALVAVEADVNQVADIIAAKVSGPGYREETFKMAHRLDQLEAARHIIAALSKPTPVEAGLREALAKIMPIRVHDGPDYAEVFFADGSTHSTQAMTMNPQDWLAINDAFAALSETLPGQEDGA